VVDHVDKCSAQWKNVFKTLLKKLSNLVAYQPVGCIAGVSYSIPCVASQKLEAKSQSSRDADGLADSSKKKKKKPTLVCFNLSNLPLKTLSASIQWRFKPSKTGAQWSNLQRPTTLREMKYLSFAHPNFSSFRECLLVAYATLNILIFYNNSPLSNFVKPLYILQISIMSVLLDYGKCPDRRCENGARCAKRGSLPTDFYCECPEGFTGRYCGKIMQDLLPLILLPIFLGVVLLLLILLCCCICCRGTGGEQVSAPAPAT